MSQELLRPAVTRRNFFGIVGLGIISMYIASNFPAYLRMYRTSRDYAACFNGEISENENFPFNAIAVPAGGITVHEDGSAEPNDFQKLRLEAAAVAYIQKQAPGIILLGENTDETVDPDLDINYLKAEVKRLSNGEIELPAGSVIVERISINTASNMHELAGFTRSENLHRVLLITNYFHSDRAEILACANGINAYARSAEEILIGFDPTAEENLRLFYESRSMDDIINNEIWGIWATAIDTRGNFQTFLKKMSLGFQRSAAPSIPVEVFTSP